MVTVYLHSTKNKDTRHSENVFHSEIRLCEQDHRRDKDRQIESHVQGSVTFKYTDKLLLVPEAEAIAMGIRVFVSVPVPLWRKTCQC